MVKELLESYPDYAFKGRYGKVVIELIAQMIVAYTALDWPDRDGLTIEQARVEARNVIQSCLMDD